MADSVGSQDPGATARATHWDAAYDRGASTRSWYQDYPRPSMAMLERASAAPDDAVIDVGAGASGLVDALLDKGFHDLTVLDVSRAGITVARERLGPRGEQVHWVVTDLLTWTPPRSYRVWHDRAVFHFLTDPLEREKYLEILTAATEPGSIAVFATFAEDGPRMCSGLPTARYSPEQLLQALGEQWTELARDRELHTTPSAATQAFTWLAVRRR